MTPLEATVRAAVAGHVPADPVEHRARRRALALIDWLPAPLDEHADPAHVTGSAIVLDAHRRVLLHRHKRLGLWLQPGGHLDPGEPPWAAAVRETTEETGLDAAHPRAAPRLLHVDVHEGPRGHLHLDLRYLLLADAAQGFAPAPGESTDLAWCTWDEATRRADRSLLAGYAAALAVTTPPGGPR